MPLPVRLQDVVDAMEPLSDEWQAYINRKTGEIVSFSEEEAAMAEQGDADAPEWMKEDLPQIQAALSSDDYARLPGKFEFNEYAVMEQFCLSLSSAPLQDRLLAAIRGRGAFGRFKRAIDETGVAPQWFAYRSQALKELAVAFLEDEDIPYTDR